MSPTTAQLQHALLFSPRRLPRRESGGAPLQRLLSLRRPAGLAIRAAAGVETINGKKINGGGGLDQAALRPGGMFIEGWLVYRQTFAIRSYEIGPDKTATMESIMNLLQETALNHVSSSGLAGDGFGATREMSLRKLIWVVTRVHVQVEKYSSWGDVVEIDTWVDAAGKNGMKRDWIIRDYSTGVTIARATSTWVIMNRETRHLAKLPEPVREEVSPFYLRRAAIPGGGDAARIEKLDDRTAQNIRSGLAPRWGDMDANQHVNNVKYISWILESVPGPVLEAHRLASITLEYRRECRLSHALESLTSVAPPCGAAGAGGAAGGLSTVHLLRLQEDKAEIVRARAEWRRKT
ncbi:palmitoyl-acyl carrier protein thioesterase, chloroplastic-like [Wolffia australiana]